MPLETSATEPPGSTPFSDPLAITETWRFAWPNKAGAHANDAVRKSVRFRMRDIIGRPPFPRERNRRPACYEHPGRGVVRGDGRHSASKSDCSINAQNVSAQGPS